MNSSSELNKESKNMFNILKSDYFLQILFNIILKKKSLVIIKYNKNMKDRMNISIKDYKEYSEIYSSIEIEIKPVSNQYGNFINIVKENEEDEDEGNEKDDGNEEYYHIYFNNNKEEIKRYYLKTRILR